MKKRVITVLFLLCAAGQLHLSLSSVLSKENTLKKGSVHKFRTRPVDPYDPFRGKYVSLALEDSIEVFDDHGYREGMKVAVLLEKDEEGFSRVLRPWKSCTFGIFPSRHI